jgi:hypothetical protein
MNEHKMYGMKVTRDQFGQLLDDYSESGYTNSSYSDIIIDLFNVEDHRAEFAELIGLPLDKLPEEGLMNLYP